jgi:hypothetical protein
MPDISMCTGGKLPMCQHCYRRTAKPSERQSFFGTPPDKDGKCEYYWANYTSSARQEEQNGS